MNGKFRKRAFQKSSWPEAQKSLIIDGLFLTLRVQLDVSTISLGGNLFETELEATRLAQLSTATLTPSIGHAVVKTENRKSIRRQKRTASKGQNTKKI